MEKDYGMLAFVFGIINIIIGLEVAIFISIIKGDYRWTLPYSVGYLFNMLSSIILLLTVIFGRVGIKKGSSKNIVYAGIILGFIGLFIMGIPFIEIVVFRN